MAERKETQYRDLFGHSHSNEGKEVHQERSGEESEAKIIPSTFFCRAWQVEHSYKILWFYQLSR